MKNQFFISSNQSAYPFAHLFKHLTPKDFASTFGGEAEQTIAFLLSFSRNKIYIKKVLKILDDKELTDAVSYYLRNVANEGVDPEFVNKIETYLESSLQHWKDLSSSKRLRKNIFIRGKKPVKSSKIDEKKKENKKNFGEKSEKKQDCRLFPESLLRYIYPYRRKETMKIQYKNETSELVNIRGKKLKPGESIVSQTFIKHFEEYVRKENLTIYVDGEKISFEQVPVIEAEITASVPAADAGSSVKDEGSEGAEKSTGPQNTGEADEPLPETNAEITGKEAGEPEATEEQSEIAADTPAEEAEGDFDELSEEVEAEAAQSEIGEYAVDEAEGEAEASGDAEEETVAVEEEAGDAVPEEDSEAQVENEAPAEDADLESEASAGKPE
jgi:hypothetical protein